MNLEDFFLQRLQPTQHHKAAGRGWHGDPPGQPSSADGALQMAVGAVGGHRGANGQTCELNWTECVEQRGTFATTWLIMQQSHMFWQSDFKLERLFI